MKTRETTRVERKTSQLLSCCCCGRRCSLQLPAWRRASCAHHFNRAIRRVVDQLVLTLQARGRVIPLDSEAIASVRLALRHRKAPSGERLGGRPVGCRSWRKSSQQAGSRSRARQARCQAEPSLWSRQVAPLRTAPTTEEQGPPPHATLQLSHRPSRTGIYEAAKGNLVTRESCAPRHHACGKLSNTLDSHHMAGILLSLIPQLAHTCAPEQCTGGRRCFEPIFPLPARFFQLIFARPLCPRFLFLQPGLPGARASRGSSPRRRPSRRTSRMSTSATPHPLPPRF